MQNKFTQFATDVTRAYIRGIVCPITGEWHTKVKNRHLACALSAAYIYHNGKPECGTLSETLISDWAREHYKFSTKNLNDIISAFDYPSMNWTHNSEAVKTGIKLNKTFIKN